MPTAVWQQVRVYLSGSVLVKLVLAPWVRVFWTNFISTLVHRNLSQSSFLFPYLNVVGIKIDGDYGVAVRWTIDATTLEIRGSNPVIGKLYITHIVSTVLKKRPGSGHVYFRHFYTADSKMFNINCADDWIRTANHWNRKQPLYQLSHNHCPFSFPFPISCTAFQW